MKKINLSLFIFSLLLLSCSTGGNFNNDTPEGLGKIILEALRNNDKELYQQHIYTAHEIDYLMANGADKLDREREMQRIQEYGGHLKDSFDRMIKNASKEGLNDWADVTFSKVTYDLQANELEARNASIEFIKGDFVGTIALRTIFKSDRGRFMVGVPEFGRYTRFQIVQ